MRKKDCVEHCRWVVLVVVFLPDGDPELSPINEDIKWNTLCNDPHMATAKERPKREAHSFHWALKCTNVCALVPQWKGKWMREKESRRKANEDETLGTTWRRKRCEYSEDILYLSIWCLIKVWTRMKPVQRLRRIWECGWEQWMQWFQMKQSGRKRVLTDDQLETLARCLNPWLPCNSSVRKFISGLYYVLRLCLHELWRLGFFKHVSHSGH